MFPIRILATAAVAVLGGASAFGQGCDTPGGCGHSPLFGTGALFAPNKHLARMPDANHPLCATKTYPISDWHYISKYCGPTLNPGTCYGYYPTKWRKWEDICPPSPAVTGLPIYQVIPPVESTPLPMPSPIPPKTDPVPPPKTDPPKTDPVPKSSVLLPESPLAPAPLPPSATISAMPPTVFSPVEHGKIVPMPGVQPPPLKTLPNNVVPPVRDFPERSRN